MGWRTSHFQSYGTWGKEWQISLHSTRPVMPVQTLEEIHMNHLRELRRFLKAFRSSANCLRMALRSFGLDRESSERGITRFPGVS